MIRPDFRVLDIENGRIWLRHCVVLGRPLGNYVLPYWPIHSFLSLVDLHAELAHRPGATVDGREILFIIGDRAAFHQLRKEETCWPGFQLARKDGLLVLRTTNEGQNSLLAMENYIGLRNGENAIEVVFRIRNASRGGSRMSRVA